MWNSIPHFPKSKKQSKPVLTTYIKDPWITSDYYFLSSLHDRSKSAVFYRLDCDFLLKKKQKRQKRLTTPHVEGVETSWYAMHIILQTYFR